MSDIFNMPVTYVPNPDAADGQPVSGGTVGGAYALPVTYETGTVTGLGLASVPVAVALTVCCPDSSNIFATLTSALSTDGFSFTLSAAPMVTGYTLMYTFSF